MARQTQTIYLKGIPAIRAKIHTRQRMLFPKLKAKIKKEEEETTEEIKELEEQTSDGETKEGYNSVLANPQFPKKNRKKIS